MNAKKWFALILVLIATLVPALPASAAADGVSLSCHISTVDADCLDPNGFTVTAWVDPNYQMTFTVDGVAVIPTIDFSSSNANWSISRFWSETSFDETTICDKVYTLVVKMYARDCTTCSWYLYQTMSDTFGGPECCDPEFVSLASSSVSAGREGTLIQWETGTEIANLGFNIYRSAQDDAATAVQINEALIPSKAFGGMAGASYEFTDAGARLGQVCYYWLEDIAAVGECSGMHALGRAARSFSTWVQQPVTWADR